MDSRSIPPFILLLILFAHDVHATETDEAHKKCGNIRRLKSTPGTGWDSLESKALLPILDIQYDQCLTTDDGLFATPNRMEVKSVKRRRVEVELITDWSNYNPMTARSLKSESIKESQFSKIDGFFTQDYAHTKRRQLKKNYATVRTTVRNVVYQLTMRSDERLDTKFADRLDQIAGEIKVGNFKGATHLTDTVVREYGTHLVHSVDVGGVFGRDDYFSINYVEKNAELVAETARSSFLDAMKMGNEGAATKTASAANLSSYESLRRGHRMFTIGGVDYKEKLNLEEWESGLYDNLAVIDQSGARLDFALRRMALNMSDPFIVQTMDYVQNAVEKYYRVNIHKGCVAIESPLFDGTVNFDAGEICTRDLESQYLGGFYQTCTLRANYETNYCENYTFNNGMSGFSTCPVQYNDQAVIHADIVHLCPAATKSIKKSCIADVTTHVCLTNAEPSAFSKTHSFGGVYSSFVENMMTKSRSCPAGFDPIGMLGNSELFVCVGDETVEEAEVAATSFGGLCREFDKCPNTSCPAGYSQHFGTFYNGREIYYCARMGSNDMKFEAVLLRPPYLNLEDEETESRTVATNKPVLFCLLINVLIGLALDL